MMYFKKVISLLKLPSFQQVIKLSVVSLFSNFLAFFIPVIIGNEFGVSHFTDTFFLSYSIIAYAGVVFTEAVRTVVIPFLVDRKDDISRYTSFVSTVTYYLILAVGSLCILLILIGLIFIWVVEDNLLIVYVTLSLPIFFFMIINAFGYGILNAKNKFYLAELSPVSRAIIIITCIYLFKASLGMYAAIIGYLLGEIVKSMHLTYVIIVRSKVIIDFKTKNFYEISDFVRVGKLQILSSSISSSYPLITRGIASFLSVGAISLIEYGDRVFMIFSVALSSLLVVMLSKWSNDLKESVFTIGKLNRVVGIVVCVCIVLLISIFFSKEIIISTLYPKLAVEDVNLIATILLISMVGFVFNAANQVVNRAILATKATNLLLKASIFKIIVNLILSIPFAYFFGIIGLVWATVIVHIFGLIINYYFFSKLELIQKHDR